MNTAEIYSLADRYLAGDLNKEELHELNKRLVEETDFAKIFSEYLAVSYAAEKTALMANFVEKDKIAPPIPQDKKIGKVINLRRIAAVAAIFMVFLVGYWFWSGLSNQKNILAESTEIIYQQQIYSETTMSSNDFTTLFRQKKYQEALTLLQEEALDIQTAYKPQNLQRQGFCYWELNDFQGALTTFEALEKDPVYLPNKNPARYYQALTYWKMDDKKKAIELLKGLVDNPNHAYSEKAAILLKKIPS